MNPSQTMFNRFWAKLAGSLALGYYSLAVTILLIEYLSESNKLSRGMYTDTFNPLVISEILTWPSSSLVTGWKGYPEPANQSAWQKALNDSLPPHLLAVVVQAILIFLIIEAMGIAFKTRRSQQSLNGKAR